MLEILALSLLDLTMTLRLYPPSASFPQSQVLSTDIFYVCISNVQEHSIASKKTRGRR